MITALAVWVLLCFAIMLTGAVVAAGLAVSWLRRRLTWQGEGLIMHELIAPMGELQDPEFGDRRRWAAGLRG